MMFININIHTTVKKQHYLLYLTMLKYIVQIVSDMSYVWSGIGHINVYYSLIFYTNNNTIYCTFLI